ncbi:FAD-binding domain-containing protein [Cantharellus anzutake]|uniref:FAD-binding domain-containing protein n=1 Tax=Cantharellus anzutake TaxID=1750568 RepID=UPI001904DD5B|nr:FAD-binding domain-containing protein [Cantharellus anzutake]KAF8337005.1 FAD-binding domain-containing protein [Cantharellus anzutake]
MVARRGGAAVATNDSTCLAIQQAISNASSVYYPSDPHYSQDIWHFMSSSVQYPKCTVEPGTVDDVSKIMKILAKSTSPFAVKCGGHASNQGFSSTTGVLIAMTRFNKVIYHPKTSTADIPTGVIWDDVYAALEPHGVNVVGGRVSGIGATGVTLGGGYSWLTNLHGLTVDSVTAFELVLPSGKVVEVTNHNKFRDLFFGLKGGYNNFGIVTRFTLKTYPQGQIWAGLILYSGSQWSKLADAIVDFQHSNTDPNANVLPVFNQYASGTQVTTVLVFYNKPTAPPGLFDRFLNIPSISQNVTTRNFLDFVLSVPSHTAAGFRYLRDRAKPISCNSSGAFMGVSLARLSPSILKTILAEIPTWSAYNQANSGLLVSYDIEPFLTSIPKHATPSAFPHDKFASPLNIYFAWTSPDSDDAQIRGIKQTAANIAAAAKAEGQDIDSLTLYPNNCLADTPLEKMYGNNVQRLKKIKEKYDPLNVMGRTGGFKF